MTTKPKYVRMDFKARQKYLAKHKEYIDAQFTADVELFEYNNTRTIELVGTINMLKHDHYARFCVSWGTIDGIRVPEIMERTTVIYLDATRELNREIEDITEEMVQRSAVNMSVDVLSAKCRIRKWDIATQVLENEAYEKEMGI